jgi:tellurite resistance protein
MQPPLFLGDIAMKRASPLQHATLGIIHAVIFSDGEIRPSEVGWIHSAVRKHNSFRDLSSEEFAMACAEVLDEFNSAPLKVVMERWVRALSGYSASRSIAFELAVDAVLADGEIADMEEGMLLYLAKAWDISDRERELAYREALDRKASTSKQ